MQRRASGAESLDESTAETQIHDNYLVVRADRKYYKIKYDDLIYIEAQNAYITFYTKKQQITALVRLKELEEKLPADRFVRIHRSFLVSIDRIRSFDGTMVEIGKKKLPVSKSYQKSVADIFGLSD